jgi:hypothetical protein
MVSDTVRLSEFVRAKVGEENEILLESREETGRGKRFGMNGEITLNDHEAKKLAQWVFAREFDY